MYQYPNYLMHHGVKGMKWGVRKAKRSVALANRRRISKYSEDYNETRQLRRKSSKQLSNEDLKKLNKRMNLEQEYNRLSTSSVNRGLSVAKKILSVSGVAGGLYAMSKSDYVKAGASIIKKMR